MKDIIVACLWFVAVGGVLGLLLAFAGKIFHVKSDPRADKIKDILPGANCGACGYPGCAGYADAVVGSDAPMNKCLAGGNEAAEKIAAVMGKEKPADVVRYRAQVMCSGTNELAKKKYVYDGIEDCVAANKLAAGDKMCPNGCIGKGSCVKACPFDAISMISGVASVNYDKCRACGICVDTCPKHIIKLIPFDSKYWVGCMSVDNGVTTRSYCDVGCISCKLCEKACPVGAVHVDNFVAHIDYEKCIGCGKCEKACPRKIIWSGKSQKSGRFISKDDLNSDAEPVGTTGE